MPTPQVFLVTGAAGFLGSHLCARMLADGHKVIGIDNLSMGSLGNLAHVIEDSKFHFVEKDVTDPSALCHIAETVDAVVHLAAFKIPRYGKAIDTLKINMVGTANVLDFAKAQGCKCVLASTSDVYGKSLDVPFNENSTDLVIGSSKSPRWGYAVSKLFAEHLALAYQDAYAFPVVLLRLFGSYGPNQHLSWWGGPPPVFISAVLKGETMPIHGDGMQTRSFTYCSDTIEGIYAATTRSEANGEILNIGSDEEISILDLAKMIKRLSRTPGRLDVEMVPYESFTGKKYEDARRRVPDASLAEHILGVRAIVSLEEGLSKTIAWQRNALAARGELSV